VGIFCITAPILMATGHPAKPYIVINIKFSLISCINQRFSGSRQADS